MSHHTPQPGRKPGVPAPAATPSPAAVAAAEKKTLSSKVLGMKFMQRHNEAALRKSLEAEKHTQRNEEQWTTPVRAAAPTAAAAAAANASPTAAAASPFGSPFRAASASASAAASASFPYAAAFSLPLRAPPPRGMFVDQSDTSDTPALSAAAGDTPAASAAAAAAASSDAPLPPFIPGRRSYGSFNPKIDALVSEAQAACSASGKDAKLTAKAARNSVSDDQMADAYVGLRGKGASAGRGGGGGGGAGKQGFPRNDQKKKKQQQPGNGQQHQQHRKHARADGDAAHPQKKQKKPAAGSGAH